MSEIPSVVNDSNPKTIDSVDVVGTTDTKSTSNDNAVVATNDVPSKTAPVLAPAPLPKSNPWGALNNEIPSTSIIMQKSNSSSSSSLSAPTNANSKWIPYKDANISISSSFDSSNNKKKQRKPANSNKKKPVNASDKKYSSSNRQKSHNTANTKNNTEKKPSQKQTPLTTEDVAPESNEHINGTEVPTSSETLSTENSAIDSTASSNTVEEDKTTKPMRQQNYKNTNTRRYNNYGNNRAHNSRYNNNASLGYVNYAPKYNNNNSNQYNRNNRSYNNRNGYQKNYNTRNPSQNHHVSPIVNWFSPEARLAAVQTLGYQLDYYFNISNLLKDMYLRKHMNSKGWINLDFISEFYRVKALSCGDLSVIKDSLDYCTQFEWGYVEPKEEQGQKQEQEQEQTAEQKSSEPQSQDGNEVATEESASAPTSATSNTTNPIQNIKIRAIREPLNWVFPVSQREGCGLDESVPTTIHVNEPMPAVSDNA